ncbi:hypothetical protein BDB01DRAFT_329847 [Pilobolus umbonatus]|nr:hypothetical protein BDB01DRAFT_329847 [Pilobolus umbonatus]
MYLPYLFLLLIYHYLPCHGYYGSIFDVVQIREREGAVSWVDNGTIYQVGGQEVPGPTVLVNTIRFDEAENIQYGAATRNMTDVCTLCAAMYVPGNRNVFISRPMENTTDFLYYNLDTNTLNLRVKPANITELPPLQDPSTAPATN